MRNGRVRHNGGQKNIHLATGYRAFCLVPFIEVHFLKSHLLTVELPIFIDGDRLSSLDQGFHGGYIWFVAHCDVAGNILATVSRIVLILGSQHIECRNRYIDMTYLDVNAFYMTRGIPFDHFMTMLP